MIDKKTLEDLEFEKILSLIKRHSLSECGAALISPEAVTCDEEVIKSRVKRIDEILVLLEKSEVMPERFVSLSPIFETARRTHASFSGLEIYSVSAFLSSLRTLSLFLSDESIFTPLYLSLLEEIEKTVEADGSVRETHPAMLPLIRNVEAERARRSTWSGNFISEHAEIARNANPVFRNERVSLAIKREEREKVKGYVQGASSSGATLYIEPFELVELNNRVVLAEQAVTQMKTKLLNDLSLRIRSLIKELEVSEEFVADFDFHYSLSLFVKEFKCNKVLFSKKLTLLGARHPLLASPVPISLDIDEKVKAVVLSGANAGGKTVSMKSVAVMVLLAQLSGYAPVEEGTTLPLYQAVYTDIGDGQSIDRNFSTFSAHMARISFICRKADERSLILLDEAFAGTDPSEGAALTISLLEYLSKRVGTVFITTHYGEVKLFAYGRDDMLNSSMEFDEVSSLPTYRIIEGLPGESHAVETAKKHGLPRLVTANARKRINSSESLSRLLADLQGRQRALDRKIGELESEKRSLQVKEKALEAEKRELELERFEIKQGRADELNDFLRQERKELEALVKELREGELTREKNLKVKAYLKHLEDKNKEVRESLDEDEERLTPTLMRSFKVGDEVLCGKVQKRGLLLKQVSKGKWQVSIDAMKLILSEKDLSPAPKEKKVTLSPYKGTTPMPSSVLDVRGDTLSEVKEKLDEEIERCLVHSIRSFSVIHGYGSGVLSRGIHEYLKERSNVVKDFYFALPEDGGMGKTYVFLF